MKLNEIINYKDKRSNPATAIAETLEHRYPTPTCAILELCG